jgi:addiction module HigA family antidote
MRGDPGGQRQWLRSSTRASSAVTQHRLAVSIGVPPRRINEIVLGKRRITADTALRLARYFGTRDRFWLNLQTQYDLETEKDRLGGALEQIRPLQTA